MKETNLKMTNEMMKGIILISILSLMIIIGGCIGNQLQTTQTNTIQTETQNTGKYILNSSKNINSSNHENSNIETNTSKSNENVKTFCELNKVYFIYADWCPHCQKMKPWVAQLESEGYMFVKIDSQNQESVNLAKECLTGIAQLRYIPEFVCIANKKNHVGEFASIDEMKAFVSACNNVQ